MLCLSDMCSLFYVNDNPIKLFKIQISGDRALKKYTSSLFHVYRWGNGDPKRLMSYLGAQTLQTMSQALRLLQISVCLIPAGSTDGGGRRAALWLGRPAVRQQQMATRWPTAGLAVGIRGKAVLSLPLWLLPCLYSACWLPSTQFFRVILGTELKVLGMLDKSTPTVWYL